MDTTKQSPVIISLCTGMLRGLEVGIERALGGPVTVAAYAEIEAFVVANLIAGMEASVLAPAPVWTDLKSFPWQEFSGTVHGIIGGYPCQPFSVAGNQKGKDDPRHLWPFIKEGIEKIKPQFCFFENVRGHLKFGFEQVYNDLCQLGYTVRFGIYSAEEVGAPHRRERLFILAVLDNTCGDGLESVDEVSTRRDSIIPSGEKLDDSGLLRPEIRQEQAARIIESSESMGYNESSHQWMEWEGLQTSKRENRGSSYDFPAGQGNRQYSFEHPRITQSGLGCTINGYNFREDLLRGIGNGVVEQTAAKAFIDLWSKL